MFNDCTTTVYQELPVFYLPQVMGLIATGQWQLNLILDSDPQTTPGTTSVRPDSLQNI